MYYTWGYLKENALSKLNLSEEEANEQGFLSRFPYQANEAMTQICSGVFPHEKFYEVTVVDKLETWKALTKEFDVYNNTEPFDEVEDETTSENGIYERKQAFWKKWNNCIFIDESFDFPEDFISFSQDIAEFKPNPIMMGGQLIYSLPFTEANDEILQYHGHHSVICHEYGIYRIPYNARWFFFTKELPNSTILNMPADICDAIPSYIASQCYKIDNEQKAAIYRNEYELFLSRIDDTSFRAQRTLNVKGGW